MIKAVAVGVLVLVLPGLAGCDSHLAAGWQSDVSALRDHLSGSSYDAIAVSDQTLDWRIH